MGRVSEIGEQLWTGELSPAAHHPWAALHELEELDTGIAFVSSFAKPAPAAALAIELADLAGGAGRLAARAEHLAERGDLALACHLAELAAQAAPADDAVATVRASVYARRAERETSLMARGLYRWAADRKR